MTESTTQFEDDVREYASADKDLVAKKKALDKIFQKLTAAYADAMSEEKKIQWIPATYKRLISRTPLKLAFTVINQKSKIWKTNNTVYLKISEIQIKHSFLIDSIEKLDSTTSEVVLTVHRDEMESLDWTLIGEASDISQCSMLPFDDRLIVLQEASKLNRSIKLGNQTVNSILDQLYGKKTADIKEELVPTVMPASTVNFKSSPSIKLLKNQIEAIKKCCSQAPTVFIEAPFGTGKTLVGSHLAVTLAKSTTTPILVVSATNAAIARFAETLASMNGGERIKAVRLVTDDYKHFKGSIRDDFPSTSIDSAEILKRMEERPSSSLSNSKKKYLSEFNSARNYVREIVLRQKDSSSRSNFATDSQFKNFRSCAKIAEEHSKHMMKILLEDYRPNVILMTIDYLLLLSKNSDFYSYVKNTKMVIVDESSQILEIAFLTLMSKFPNAHFRFFGDSKQLNPFTKSDNPSLCIPILQRFQRNNQSEEVMLTTTCRSHPALNELPNLLFYNNKLQSGADESGKSEILKKIKLPNMKKPTVFVNDDSDMSDNNPDTGSWSNKSEKEVCLKIVHNLKKNGVKSEEIGIICFYLDQKELIQSSLKDVEVRTVDSFQGREKEVIILLTTRTYGGVSAFLLDKKRINVAITRARQALFIIGKADYLQQNNQWHRIIRHHREIFSYIQKNDLDKFWPTTLSLPPISNNQCKQATLPITNNVWKQATLPITNNVWKQATLPITNNVWKQATLPISKNQCKQATLPITHNVWKQATPPISNNQCKQATPPISNNQCKQATLPITNNVWKQATPPISNDQCKQATLPITNNQCKQATLPITNNVWKQATNIGLPTVKLLNDCKLFHKKDVFFFDTTETENWDNLLIVRSLLEHYVITDSGYTRRNSEIYPKKLTASLSLQEFRIQKLEESRLTLEKYTQNCQTVIILARYQDWEKSKIFASFYHFIPTNHRISIIDVEQLRTVLAIRQIQRGKNFIYDMENIKELTAAVKSYRNMHEPSLLDTLFAILTGFFRILHTLYIFLFERTYNENDG